MTPQYEPRRRRLAEVLADRGLDAALVTHLVNVRYLSGFSGSNGAVLVHADGTAQLATDGRYTLQARAQSPDLELVTVREVAPELARRAVADGVRRLGFEDHHVTVEAYAVLETAADGAALEPLRRAVEALRVVKDESELQLLGEACAIADRAFADVLPVVRPGMTERELAAALEQRMVALGADGPSFDTIVAGGPNSAVPHHEPTDRPLAPGDLLKVDFGALHAGYHSDMTRTVVLGPAADWQRELHALVGAAQRAAIDALLAGTDPRDVDRTARTVIADGGQELGHGLGHGVGLEVHEAPMLAADPTPLAPGTTVTVEPGVYLPGRGGVRIEDVLVVTAADPRLLTHTPRELVVL